MRTVSAVAFLSLFRVAARSLAQSWALLCDGMWLRSANGIMSNGLNEPFGSPEERVVYVNARFRRGKRVRRSSGEQKLYQSRQVDRPSPPRVSEQVRNLEQRLGVRLIERTTRSVSATLAGEHLYQRLRPVLDDYKLALESTNVFRDRPAGPLRLTMGLPAADAIIEPLLSSFLDRYPDIYLEIAVENELVDMWRAGTMQAFARASALNAI